jgi:deoxyinosine 3'endonuclease (endonuclease V)
MIAAVDVHYWDNGMVTATAIVFAGFNDSREQRIYTRKMHAEESYIPGQIY